MCIRDRLSMLRGPAPARRSPAAKPSRVGAVGSRYRKGAAQAEPGLPEARRVGRDQKPPPRTCPMPRQSVRRGIGVALLPCQRAFGACLSRMRGKRASPVLRGAGRSNAPGLPGDETGRRLTKARLPEGISGIARLHALVGRFLPEDGDPAEVKIGIETDRGPWVAALVASGYQ